MLNNSYSLSKVYLLVLAAVLLGTRMYAQNVGIGTALPNTGLDIVRDLALREAAAVTISAMNQINSGSSSHLRVTNTGTINEILNPQDGKVLYLINNSGGTVVLANNTPPASANKIVTGSGANYSLPSGATAHLIYNATNQAWQLAGVSPGATGTNNAWLLLGNAGTNEAVNFVGTTDCNSLRFRVNNQFSGLIECAANNGNTTFGYNTPANPTASGAIRNVAVGDRVLSALTTGDDNTAVGYRALASNTGGFQNVSIGSQVLTNNISGSGNVAAGFAALFNNTTGDTNVAIGNRALVGNTGGSYNVAIGLSPLFFNSSGSHNVAIGNASHLYNTNGSYNTAVGYHTLYGCNTGTNNTAVGASAGASHVGNNNVFVGVNSGMNGNHSNAIAIGSGATVTSSNRIRMGGGAITNADIQVAWTVTSDRNEKSEIKYDVPGLKFITQLRPVTYYYNSHLQAHGKEKSIRYTGLLAQEVDSVLRGLGIVSSIVSKPNADGSGSWGIRYAEIVMPLIKGMQEQQAQIEALQQENARLEAELTSVKAAFEVRLKLLEERAGIKAEK